MKSDRIRVPLNVEHVAIIGGGFSGSLQAINLHRHGGPRATLIERRPMAGDGLAYGAASPSHVLNVRASNMSALPDDPAHFVRWLEAHGVPDAAHAFVPRITYGAYLRELLDETMRKAAGRLRIVHGVVDDVKQEMSQSSAVRVSLADGRTIEADAAVLAVGNLAPHTPAGLDPEALSSDLYKADPWDPTVADGLGADDTVLVIGTGLTMIDVALLLDKHGFAGKILAMSRRGLLPRRHAEAGAPWRRINERPASVASGLVRAVRARAGEIGWRQAVDELRTFTQDIWRAATEAERGRFLRHLRPWWDVHRHRLAPEVASRIEAMRAAGRLDIVAGKPVSFVPGPFAQRACAGQGIEVTWRPRGETRPQALTVRRVINCTGPQGDLLRTDDPLLQRLVARGIIRPDAARLGIDVDAQARTVAADGASNDWLFALGPMTRGAFWEIVAVPDIRAQTWSLARRLSNAHWVGGEGL